MSLPLLSSPAAPMVASCLSVLAAGVLVRFWGEEKESMHLSLAGILLRPGDEERPGASPLEVATLLERTRMVLCATRLVRQFSFLLTITPVCVLLAGAPGLVPGAAGRLAEVALATTALFLALVGFSWMAQKRGHSAALNARAEPPGWLLDSEEHAPGLVVAGWLVWDRLLRTVDTILHPFGVVRPAAQLVEIEDRVRLALEPRRPGRPAQNGDGAAGPAPDNDLEPTEQEMIRAIQRLDRTFVREIMRPVNQVTAIRLRDYNPKRFLALAARTGYTRIPCYEDHLLNLTGYINVYDILEPEEPPADLREIVTQPLYVPEVARVNQVLQQMMAQKQQVAIVFDEFGGTSGWLSREDILEEIVGDLEDEFERSRQKVVAVRGGWLVDPTIDLDDLEDELDIELPRKQADTLAGYIYYRLGRAPRRGETLEEQGWRIRIAGVEGHRIRRVRLLPPPDQQDEADGE